MTKNMISENWMVSELLINESYTKEQLVMFFKWIQPNDGCKVCGREFCGVTKY